MPFSTKFDSESNLDELRQRIQRRPRACCSCEWSNPKRRSAKVDLGNSKLKQWSSVEVVLKRHLIHGSS